MSTSDIDHLIHLLSRMPGLGPRRTENGNGRPDVAKVVETVDEFSHDLENHPRVAGVLSLELQARDVVFPMLAHDGDSTRLRP